MRHGFAMALSLWVSCLWCGMVVAAAPEHELEAVRAETMRPYAGPATEAQPHEGLKGKILCGYQGWFNTPDDGASLGWKHWFRDGKRPPDLNNIGTPRPSSAVMAGRWNCSVRSTRRRSTRISAG